MEARANENSGTKELVHFLNLSNEALRIKNLRLESEIERLRNNIEVHDAMVVSNGMDGYYQFMNHFNYTLKKQ